MQTRIAHDMRHEIFETDWELFKEHYMDFFPTDKNLDAYLHAIAACHPGLLRATRSGYQFQGKFKFSNVGLHEDEFFEPLESIWKHTAEVVKNVTCNGDERSNPKIRFKLVLKPEHRNDSSINGITHAIDGYFHSTAVQDEGCSSYHRSIPVCAEFKKTSQNPAEVVKNRRQLVTDANFNMNNDPRRMFTFGITIEGDDCSVWYFSRSHSAKSKSFQWKGAHLRQFIGTIIAFTFAEPEKLGFDPAITLIRKPTECYLYRIDKEVPEGDKKVLRSRFVKTEESISELHTTCITGRATRVWKTFEVDQDLTIINSQAVVLKDVWLDEDAQTERSIQKQIFDSIDAFKKKIHLNSSPPEFKNLSESFRERVTNLLLDGDRYRDYFLTIITDSVTDPCKPALHLVGKSQPCPNLLYVSEPRPPVKNSSNGDHIFTSKKRNCVVFKEVCSAIHCQTSFSEVMTAMEGALLAIFLLFAAGWVHRDISTGNILWYKPSGDADNASRGILSDLEYAKMYRQDKGSADPKIGTPYFMPMEILKGDYWFHLWLPADSKVPVDLSVKHNFLHDMESFFWVFLLIICTVFPKPESNLIDVAQTIFSDTFGSWRCRSIRETIIIGYRDNASIIGTDILPFLDASLSTIAPAVRAMVKQLNSLYRSAPDNNCEHDKSRISVIFDSAMTMIHCAKKVKAPAIRFKHILALGESQEAQKHEADHIPAEISQNRRPEKRKAVDNPAIVEGEIDIPLPVKRRKAVNNLCSKPKSKCRVSSKLSGSRNPPRW